MKTTHKFGYILPANISTGNTVIVQVESVEGTLFTEHVNTDLFYKTAEQDTKPEADNSADFIEACETELKSDPFKSGWHNGHKLIEIRENDPEWWARALKELKNNFIVAKMRTIEEGIANGKIYS
jgi:hypothetical protein